MKLIPKILDKKWFQFIFLFFITFIHLIVSPFTKVEESFQIQGIHDFLKIGFPHFYHCAYNFVLKHDLDFDFKSCFEKTKNVSNYENYLLFDLLPLPSHSKLTYLKWDHEEFPGVVPRTFIPSFVVSLISWPYSIFIEKKFYLQIIARLNLGILVIIPLLEFGSLLKYKFGYYTSTLFFIITCTQFHFLYYASRTLPNTFALILVLWGYVFWINRNFYALIVTSAFCVLIFRFETCIIFGVIFLIELFFYRSLSMLIFLILGIISGFLAITTTIIFDSFMWGKLIWPELDSMYFNLYLNKSHLWGTFPFYWYFTNAIPKIMLLSLVFCFFSTKSCCLKFYPIILVYVGLHSYLPHKELRFIIYIIPLLNVCAANSIDIIFMYLEPSLSIPKSWLVSLFYNYILKVKYPGEIKNSKLNKIYQINKLGYLNEKNEDFENFDYKEDSWYKTFLKEEIKELENIRPDNCLLRKRKLLNSKRYKKKSIKMSFFEEKNNFSNLYYKDLFLPSLNKVSLKIENNLDSENILNNLKTQFSLNENFKNISIKKKKLGFIIKVMLLTLHLCINFAISTYILFVSLNNYPGGDASIWLNENIPKHLAKYDLRTKDVVIHIDNLAAQTGFTRFTQNDEIVYDKSLDFLPLTIDSSHNNFSDFDSNKYNFESFNVNLTKFKLVYLVLENLDFEFINKYCTPLIQTQYKLLFNIDRYECTFNKIKKCRILAVIFGFESIYLGLDRKFLNIKKIPMLYIYRCLNF